MGRFPDWQDEAAVKNQERALGVGDSVKAVTKNRLQELDSLRGLAALSVVFSHHLIVVPIFYWNTEHRHIFANVLKYSPLHVFWTGHEAVVLFFIMSGFVLSLPFYAHKAGSYKDFLIRRFCRIYIPYFFAVVFAFAACALFAGDGPKGLSPWFYDRWQGAITARDFWNHIALIKVFQCNNYDPVLWSLVHEARISLVFPILMWIVMRLDWRIALVIAYAVAAFGYGFDKQPFITINMMHTLDYLPMFVVGMLLARYKDGIVERARGLHASAQYALLALGLCAYTYPWAFHEIQSIHTPQMNDTAITFGAALILVLSLSSLRISRALNIGAVQFLGRISYSLYLYHAVVLLALIHTLGTKMPLPAILLISLPLGVAISWLAYTFIEAPSIQLGKLLTGRRTEPRSTNVVPVAGAREERAVVSSRQ